MRRIGVFVCHCGSNIAATVDVKKVVEMAMQEQGVVHAEDYPYMCSEAGQQRIAEAIREKNLEGIVVCSCSPRMHEATFRKTAQRAGLNPYMVEIANIREQCSWVLKDKAIATEKAIQLTKAAIAKVRFNDPLHPGQSQVVKRALVIGGGMAYTFLKAQGYEIGTSLVEEEKVEYAKEMMEKAKAKGVKLLLPIDNAVSDKFADVKPVITEDANIPQGFMGLDIGPKTIEEYVNTVNSSKTIVWNGPMGVFEFENFANGTLAVAKAMAALTDATTVIGGGDSAAAVNQLVTIGKQLGIEVFEMGTTNSIKVIKVK